MRRRRGVLARGHAGERRPAAPQRAGWLGGLWVRRVTMPPAGGAVACSLTFPPVGPPVGVPRKRRRLTSMHYPPCTGLRPRVPSLRCCTHTAIPTSSRPTATKAVVLGSGVGKTSPLDIPALAEPV